ncbi:MAG: ornithine carbamoyltransferase [Syntrophomonadaceae bacterium]|nr:ornithine carbamoyltransferase [Syntrophomonadaceae bacterium]
MPQIVLDPGFRGRDFISIHDYTEQEVYEVFRVASWLKEKQRKGQPHPLLAGKTLGMIFTKSSTRTRVSFEVGIYQLGGYGLFLSANDLQLRRGETIGDTAQTLSRYLDGIMIRTFDHQDVLDLAWYATIPVINGLTDLLHPCQVMGDLFTIQEKKGRLKGLKLAFIGDGNNVAHSLLFGGAKVGMDVTIACPRGYEPNSRILELARQDAEVSGAELRIVHDPGEAVKGADVVYTDVWASMGMESEVERRKYDFVGFQVNRELLTGAKPEAIVMHCLPAHRGEEITDEVMDGPQSVVFDEAENRLHVQKAIMALVMAD